MTEQEILEQQLVEAEEIHQRFHELQANPTPEFEAMMKQNPRLGNLIGCNLQSKHRELAEFINGD